MGWIALAGFVSMLLAIAFALSAGRRTDFRRKDRLELAFYRARSQRMVANGIRGDRF